MYKYKFAAKVKIEKKSTYIIFKEKRIKSASKDI